MSVNRAPLGFEKSRRRPHVAKATSRSGRAMSAPNRVTKPVAASSHCGKRSRGPDIGGTLSGMDHKMTALERAFQLARSGQVSRIAEIVGSLKRDGYSTDQIQGPVLRRQLRDLIMAARRDEMN
jgi:hypothetical protein